MLSLISRGADGSPGAGDSPIDFGALEDYLRIDTSEDATLLALIYAATDFVEQHTGRAILQAVWLLTIDKLPCGDTLRLPFPPLRAVNFVKYYDTSDVLQTLSPSAYRVTAGANDSLIQFTSPPSTSCRPDAIQIEFAVGFLTPDTEMPPAIKLAITKMVAEHFRLREASVQSSISELPFGVDRLLAAYVLREVPR